MKLLVTGGAGFIGANFIHHILRKYPDYRVVNLDALTYAGNLENLKMWENDARYRFVKGDIADPGVIEPLVAACDIVVHFAAESHVDRSILDPGAFIRTNVQGTQVLLEAAKQHNKRFHHVSTDEVFGALGPDDAPFDERTPYDPRSPYSASKAASDHLVRAYFHTYGLPITISNCSNNYGPYHFPEKLIPLAITNLLAGKNVPVYGDGRQVRDWLYVADHCQAIDLIIHQGTIGETYCVGGNSERENIWIVKQLLTLLGKDESAIEYVQDRAGHDRRYAIDFSKIKDELGWQPEVTLEEGLQKTVDWFKENEPWWKNVKSGDYQEYYARQYDKR
ncbi:MAG: dTDP-glucose 4,6-dehydratase [Candidatus Moranbacteria bacterium RIFCSPHIGHO2_12_FULL_54_9]|nr:MAG: dTDP-glucose 4,6-dehydratase [Candidatus Moranbacteria bacterium RIFCSPHIGHO2_01_FULL_54_31]OGI25689.1 MAG: dTDP-glucose 4,6-dehydratase [Candidatus Moranbacteria bacterium RIFCSPHIGHO2_12_FULL_54_9]